MSTEQFDDLEGAAQGPSRRTTLKGIAAALGAVALASPLAAAAQDVDADKKKRCRRGYPGPSGDEGPMGPKGPQAIYIAGPTGPTAQGAITAGATGGQGPDGKTVGPQLLRHTSASIVVPGNGGVSDDANIQCPSGRLLSWGFESTSNVAYVGDTTIGTANNLIIDFYTGPGDPNATAVVYLLCATSGITPAARRAGSDKGKGKGRGKSAGKRGRNDNKKK